MNRIERFLRQILAAFLLFGTYAPLMFSQALSAKHPDWWDYAGGPESSQYSPLKQIDHSNVNTLQIAWTYSTADKNKYFFNPLMIDGLLYVLAKNNSIVPLDAATGKEVWAHAADSPTALITSRGLNYWESQDRSER